MLKFKLNVAERKTLAKRMEELTGIHPYYTKAPLYSYDIGSYTIDRNGNLLVEPENADAELLTTLLLIAPRFPAPLHPAHPLPHYPAPMLPRIRLYTGCH